MSDKLSVRLLGEINDAIYFTNESEEADVHLMVEIEVLFEWVPGKRKGSRVLWAYEEVSILCKFIFSKDKNDIMHMR